MTETEWKQVAQELGAEDVAAAKRKVSEVLHALAGIAGCECATAAGGMLTHLGLLDQ